MNISILLINVQRFKRKVRALHGRELESLRLLIVDNDSLQTGLCWFSKTIQKLVENILFTILNPVLTKEILE